jgi:hypothetical protein
MEGRIENGIGDDEKKSGRKIYGRMERKIEGRLEGRIERRM